MTWGFTCDVTNEKRADYYCLYGCGKCVVDENDNIICDNPDNLRDGGERCYLIDRFRDGTSSLLTIGCPEHVLEDKYKST
jgi:hypothetical protein